MLEFATDVDGKKVEGIDALQLVGARMAEESRGWASDRRAPDRAGAGANES